VTTGREEWEKLNGNANTVMRRAEDAAKYTLPHLFLESGESTDRGDGQRLWQSIGAQLVNNLATRLMLALFAPSRPFIRLDPSDEAEAVAKDLGISPAELRQEMSLAERKTVKTLDSLALRPKLFELIKHLIVVGNVLSVKDVELKTLRVMSLRYWRVKRDVMGRVHTLVVHERVLRDELPESLRLVGSQEHPQQAVGFVDYYVVVKRDYKGKADRFTIKEWVNATEVPEDNMAYNTEYSEDECPFRVHTWTLSDESDYGVSHVMEYEGDFAGMTQVSAAQVIAGVLASEFRWLVNPAAGARVEDFENSANGAYIVGQEGAVNLVNAAGEVAAAMQAQSAMIKEYVNRLGRAFIFMSAVTRDAERVTAEEIRMLANELENGLGGGYSRLAVDVQKPLGLFLLAINKLRIRGKDIELTVVTGLDALSRHGDLENLKGWLSDIVTLQAAGPEQLAPLNLTEIYRDLASPRGIDATKYLKTQEQQKADRDEATAREVAATQATQAPQGAPAQ
jgi:Bacteriophage head to tail connecting protein